MGTQCVLFAVRAPSQREDMAARGRRVGGSPFVLRCLLNYYPLKHLLISTLPRILVDRGSLQIKLLTAVSTLLPRLEARFISLIAGTWTCPFVTQLFFRALWRPLSVQHSSRGMCKGERLACHWGAQLASVCKVSIEEKG